jgi:hypothetical protein
MRVLFGSNCISLKVMLQVVLEKNAGMSSVVVPIIALCEVVQLFLEFGEDMKMLEVGICLQCVCCVSPNPADAEFQTASGTIVTVPVDAFHSVTRCSRFQLSYDRCLFLWVAVFCDAL